MSKGSKDKPPTKFHVAGKPFLSLFLSQLIVKSMRAILWKFIQNVNIVQVNWVSIGVPTEDQGTFQRG